MDTKISWEQWPYLLFIASLPFPSLFYFRFSFVTVQLPDLLFLVAAAAWTAAFALKRRTIARSQFYTFLAAYAIAVVLSTLGSADPARSSVKLVGKFYLIGAALLTLNAVTTIDDLRRVLWAWLIGAGGALFLSLLGTFLFYAGLTDPSLNVVLHPIFGSLPPGGYPRLEGFFFYPAMLCNFLGVTWMFAILLVSANWLKERAFWFFSSGLLVVNALTFTPGIGGIFLTTAYLLRNRLFSRGKYLHGRLVMAAGITFAAAILLAASITLFSYDPEGTQVPLRTGSISPSHRAVAWWTATETFLQHPVLGYGVGMPTARSEFTDPSGHRQLLTDAHNTYLSLLAETGIVGFLTFMSVVGFLTYSLVRWRTENALPQMIRLCLLLALCDALFYQSLTGSYEDSRHVWVLFGIIAGAVKLGRSRGALTEPI